MTPVSVPVRARCRGSRAVRQVGLATLLSAWPALAPAQALAPAAAAAAGGFDPGEIGRSERQAIRGATARAPITSEQLTQAIWRELQAGGADSAETLLAQLREAGISGPSFPLQRVRFQPEAGSAILGAGELAAITGRYTGREVNFQDLLQLVADLNAAYRDRGYPLAKANLPPQDIQGGEVTVELIEARLGEVRLADSQHSFQPGWSLRRAVDQRPGEPLNLERMERALLRYNRSRGTQLGALLEAGEQFGTTDLLLEAQDPPRNQVTLVSDNAGREAVGYLRTLAVYQRHNLTGFLDDRFTLGAVYSEGTTSGYTSYDLFLPGRLPQLNVAYSQGETKVIAGGFDTLGVEGKSRSIEAGLTQTLYVDRRWTVQGGLRGALTDSETDYGGLFTQDETVQTLSLDFAASRLDARGGWIGSQRFRYIQGETLGASDDFLAASGSVSRQQRLGEHFRGSLELRYQYGDEGLPTSERFALGGVESLRGYPESGTLTDSGYLARLELSWLPWLDRRPAQVESWGSAGRDLLGSLEPFVFLDHGMGMDVEQFDGSTESRLLNSAGAGLRCGIGRYFAVSVAFAQPFELEDNQEARNLLFRAELNLPWGD